MQKRQMSSIKHTHSKWLNVWVWTKWHNSSTIYLAVRVVVVEFDVFKVSGGLEGVVLPIQLLHPGVDVWVVVSDAAEVAFEMTHINWIEAYNRSEQPDISLCELTTDQKVSPI